MNKLILLPLLTLSTLMAQNLLVTQGTVKAHTEVFGDKNIEPSTHGIVSHLTMEKGISSIKGKVDISVIKLKSDNSDRDEHMVKALESKRYPLSTYTFRKVSKDARGYVIDGVLTFHGVSKPLKVHADIQEKGNNLVLKGKSAFLLSDYQVKPIKLLFMTVRDKIDLAINVTFKKQ